MPLTYERTRMNAALHLENLPRTVDLERDGMGSASLAYVDQRMLPGALTIERTTDWIQVIDAVKALAVRGAPAIGVAGAAAVALWACNVGAPQARAHGCVEAAPRFLEALDPVAEQVASARPTAVNLAWGVRRMVECAHAAVREGLSADQVADALFNQVKRMETEDEAANRAIGRHGADLLPSDARVLTHCNAGSLATVFYGTALGVVYAAAGQGKINRVYADETRPVGQGARLTSWELARAGVPVTLICDNMAASLMSQGKVDAVVVGADRIAANGDVANKIGTFGVAVLAHHHNIPFYVAAPVSTVDLSIATGAGIPIEQRASKEVAANLPAGVDVWNPAFDVTPACLVTRIVTERGAFIPGDIARALA